MQQIPRRCSSTRRFPCQAPHRGYGPLLLRNSTHRILLRRTRNPRQPASPSRRQRQVSDRQPVKGLALSSVQSIPERRGRTRGVSQEEESRTAPGASATGIQTSSAKATRPVRQAQPMHRPTAPRWRNRLKPAEALKEEFLPHGPRVRTSTSTPGRGKGAPVAVDIPEPLEILNAWLLGSVVQAVEVGGVPGRLITETKTAFKVARHGPSRNRTPRLFGNRGDPRYAPRSGRATTDRPRGIANRRRTPFDAQVFGLLWHPLTFGSLGRSGRTEIRSPRVPAFLRPRCISHRHLLRPRGPAYDVAGSPSRPSSAPAEDICPFRLRDPLLHDTRGGGRGSGRDILRASFGE